MHSVAGIDGWRGGWLAVELTNGAFERAFTAPHLRDALEHLQAAVVVGVDMPIGFPAHGVRGADLAARELVGSRRSSVFLVPPRRVIEATDYRSARAAAREIWDRGVSAQAYALADKILELDSLVAVDTRLIEVHPEVSFRAIAGRALPSPKRSWNGQRLRYRLLESVGIRVPDHVEEAGRAPADDLLDAAVVAWTADRHSRGESMHLPANVDPGDEPVIWY